MNTPLSRRSLLQAAAGGITFLALTDDGRVAFAEEGENKGAPVSGRGYAAPTPVFKALPYIQPGPAGSLLQEGKESIVLAWKTNRLPASFDVTYGPQGKAHNKEPLSAKRTERYTVRSEDGKGTFDYDVALTDLRLGTTYEYRVRMDGKTLVEGYFTTRKPRGKRTRFVAFGDNSFGDSSDRMIAYEAYRARPDFVLNTGDNVYENGLTSEYVRYFFPIFNADTASARSGAPLLRSVPFYTVLANHDLNDSDPVTKGPVANFDKDPDALGYFTCMHLPLNGPRELRTPMPIRGAEKQQGVFLACAGNRYPAMANYSFDYGDGHFLCLDSNTYVDPTDPALQAWIEKDLMATNATWKFVTYHHPAYNAGEKHYDQQHMRVLSPIFEKCGVHIVLSGHEHTYQRTRPLRFAPRDTRRASVVGTSDRLVPGTFTVDRNFDGEKNSRADGIVYITTGAGGKYLYDPAHDQSLPDAPRAWRHKEDEDADYITRFISDRYSLTVFEMDGRSLTLQQIDQWGAVIDRCSFQRTA